MSARYVVIYGGYAAGPFTSERVAFAAAAALREADEATGAHVVQMHRWRDVAGFYGISTATEGRQR